jgi:hypothetical protein
MSIPQQFQEWQIQYNIAQNLLKIDINQNFLLTSTIETVISVSQIIILLCSIVKILRNVNLLKA